MTHEVLELTPLEWMAWYYTCDKGMDTREITSRQIWVWSGWIEAEHYEPFEGTYFFPHKSVEVRIKR